MLLKHKIFNKFQSILAQLRQPFSNPSTRNILWWGLLLGLVLGCSLVPISGFDWYTYFLPQALEKAWAEVFNPLWTYLILTPIAWLPGRWSFFGYTLVNLLLFWLSVRFARRDRRFNRFALLLSFPAFWLFWYGQMDGFVLLGAALGLWAIEKDRPLLTGLALVLLMVKPHIGAPLALAYFIWQRHWKTLIIPIAAYLLAGVFWGFDWGVDWLISLSGATEGWRTTQKANIGYFPYGLVAWLGLLVRMPRKEKALYIFSATIVSLNYVGTYSLLTLLVFAPPWWVYLLSSAPFLFGQWGYWITSLAAPGVIVWLLVRYFKPFKLAFSKSYVPLRKMDKSQSS